MATRIAKAATISAAAAIVVLALLAYSAVLAPAAAQTSTSTTSSSSSTSSTQTTTASCPGMPPSGGWGGPQSWGPGVGGFGGPGQSVIFGGQRENRVNVSVGQTITLTSTSGEYRVEGQSSENGTASGTLTFTVTGSLTDGYVLSLTSGSITVSGTTYTITSGSGQMNPSADVISAQGATSPTGSFLLQANAHGNFVSSSGQVSIDLGAGTTEYLIGLTTTIQG